MLLASPDSGHFLFLLFLKSLLTDYFLPMYFKPSLFFFLSFLSTISSTYCHNQVEGLEETREKKQKSAHVDLRLDICTQL